VLGDAAVGAGETLIFGIILVTVLVLRPDGLAGLLDPVRRRLIRRTAGAPTAAAADMPAPDISADTPLHPSGADTPGDAIALQAKGLTKVYGGVTAVNGVDLKLHEREILAVIGPNGAGKTTLMNLLSGNISPTNGSVQIFGTDVTAVPAHTVAGYGLARTFQTPSLFPGMDALANVLVGAHLRGKVGLVRSAIPTPAAVREERSLTAIAETAMTDLGLDHLRHREVSELSLGQQKLLEVARAVAQQPKILLLDEPCAGLNRVEKLNLSTMLKQLRSRGISLLLIEHDMEFVMGLADRVQVLVFGQTLAVGTPAEIQANQKVLDAYLGKEPEEDKAGTVPDQLEEESNA
jgi:ABC-type branched-subunit amino acid transport system ATPase component